MRDSVTTVGSVSPLTITAHDAADGFVAISDAHFLFHADFKRTGSDLTLTDEAGRHLLIPDYFKHEHRPGLKSPDGAMLMGDVVEALAGSVAPGQYAQAAAPAGPAAIGRVATASGNVIAMRNGVAVTLNAGDAVMQGDVIQTQSNSAVGIIFADGSTFNLDANARMVINEFVYDPNGSSNSAAINLVQGTINFLAGQVAKTGDMKVGTPVATMGIRGTLVNVTVSADNGATQVSVIAEADNETHTVTIYALPTSAEIAAGQTVGAVLGTVTNNNGVFSFIPTSTGLLVQETGKDAATLQKEQAILQIAVETKAIGQQFLQNPSDTKTAQSTQHGTTFIVSDQSTLHDTGLTALKNDLGVLTVTLNGQNAANNVAPPVIPINHAPVANADTNGVVEAGVIATNQPFAGTPAATGNVLNNDTDQDSPQGDTKTVIGLTQVSGQIHGSLSLNADGSYQYILDNTSPLTQQLAVGETVTDVFSYTVADYGGLTSTATLTITITGTDDAPTITPTTAIAKVANVPAAHNYGASISADGNFVAYDSSSSLPGVGNNPPASGHVYFYDRVADTSTLIDPTGPQHAGEVYTNVSISYDGRFAVFQGDYSGTSEIFIYDRDANSTARLQNPTTGVALTGSNAQISANGQFIVMQSGTSEILVADRNGTVVNTITTGSGVTRDPAIDASGRFVVFQSTAPTLTVGNGAPIAGAHADGTLELYLYDRATNTVTAVADLGAPGNADSNLDGPASLSVNGGTGGGRIVFASDVSNLVPGVATTHTEVYVYDLTSGSPVLKLVSKAGNGDVANGDSYGAHVSPDGNSVVFTSTATNLVAGATSGLAQTYIYDFTTNTTTLVSAAAGGTPGDGSSAYGSGVTGNGTAAVFGSGSTNLVPNDSNGKSDIFVVDLAGGTKGAVTEDVNQSAGALLKTKGAIAFTDVDLSDAHTVSVTPQGGALGTLTASVTTDTTGSGLGGVISWNYQVAEGSVESLAAFQTRIETFQITVDDGHGGTSTQTVSVTIIGTQPLITEPVFWVLNGNGDFATALNWSSAAVPGAGDDIGLIDHAGNYIVKSSINETVRTVGLIAGTTLEVAGGTFAITNGSGIGGNSGIMQVDNGAKLQLGGAIGGATFVNTGSITVNGTSAATTLAIAGTVGISGAGGAITLSDNANNKLVSNGAAATLNLDGNTISGAGLIGDANLKINNNSGQIVADGTNALTIDTASFSTSSIPANAVVNNNVIKATGTGGLVIESTSINNTVNGLVEAAGGSHIDLKNAAIWHGTVKVDALGTIDTVSGTTNLINTVNGAGNAPSPTVNILGDLIVNDNSSLTLIAPDNINNAGTIQLKSTGNNTSLIFNQTAAVLAGGGQVILSNNSHNIIAVTTAGQQLTNLDNTIRGAGEIGSGGMALINAAGGTINANVSGTLVLDPTTLSNSGQLKASSGGTLELRNSSVTNLNAIDAMAGSTVTIDQNTVVTNTGHTITVHGTGGQMVLNQATIHGGALNNFDGTGGGTIHVTGNATIDSSATLSNGAVNVDAGKTLTLDDVTVSGATITNTGTGAVQVDDGKTLTLSGAAINGGVIKDFSAGAGGTIHVTNDSSIGGSAALNKGAVNIDAGKTLTFNGASVSGSQIAGGKIANTGALTLSGGASIGSDILTNTSTVEIAGAASLTSDTVTNTGHTITVDDGQILTISGTTISGGTINDFSVGAGGTIHVTGDSKIDSTTALNKGFVTIDTTKTLTLDDVTVTGTAITNTGTGAVAVDGSHTLALTGAASITGGKVNNAGTLTLSGGASIGTDALTNTGGVEIAGAASLTGDTVTNTGHTITVDDSQTLTISGTTISGGTINDFSVGAGGTIRVSGDSKIDGTAALNKGFVTIDTTKTLTLDDVTVTGTAITNTGTGAVAVEGSHTLALTGAASISGGKVNNAGTLTLSGGASIGSSALANTSTVEIAGAASLTSDTVTNTGHTITVDDGQILTISGTTISGGTINDFSVGAGGTIRVSGDSKIDGTAALNKGFVTIDTTKTLTLDDVTVTGTAITNTGTGTVAVEGSHTLALTGSASITGGKVNNAGTLTLSGGASISTDTLTNTGGVEIAGAASLTSDIVTNTGHTITVDDGQTLTINGTTISGGTINDFSVGAGGIIHVTGDSKIDSTANLNNGVVHIDATKTLTLDDVTVTGTAITRTSGGTATIAIDGSHTLSLTGSASISNSQVNNAGALTLSGGASISDSGLTNTSTVEIAGATSFSDVSVTNTGHTITVDGGQTLTLATTNTIQGGTINNFSGVTGGIIHVTDDNIINSNATLNKGTVNIDAGKNLVLDNVSVSGTTINSSGATVFLHAATTLALSGGATINSGTLTALGTVEIAGTAALSGETVTNTGGIKVDDGQTLMISGTTIDGGTINIFSGALGGTIEVTGDSKIDSSASLNKGSVTVDTGKKLTLDGVTVSGTAITNTGTGAVAVDGSNTLALTGAASISGGKVNNAGILTLAGGASIGSGTLVNTGNVMILGAASLITETVTNTGHTITVDDGNTLTLNGATIDGGTINDYSATGGTIRVSGDSKIDSTAGLNNGFVTVDTTKTLTLDDVTVSGTAITNTGSGAVAVDSTHTLALTGLASISGGKVNNAGTLTLSGGASIGSSTLANTGSMEIAGAASLTGDTVTNTGHTITIDDGQTLTINGTTISGGTINDFSTGAGGTIRVSGDSKIDSSATLNNGFVDIDSGKSLMLDGVTVNNTTFNNNGTGALQVDNGFHLTLAGVTVAAGSVNNAGVVEVQSGTVKIAGSVSGAGSTAIDGGATLELSGTSFGQNLSFAATNATLQLDSNAAFTGGTITSLLAGDHIDLRGITYGLGTHASFAPGFFTVTDGTNTISINLTGSFGSSIFAGATDNNSGTLVTLKATDDAPTIFQATSGATAERAATTGDTIDHDIATGSVTFRDVDLTDRPLVNAAFATYTYTDAGGGSLTLTGPQPAAVEVALSITPDANSFNNGSSTWTYNVADSALDFLAQGSTLTLTYNVSVDDGHGAGGVSASQPITVTITGANDTPTPATDSASVNEDATAAAANRTTGVLANDTDPDTGDAAGLLVTAIKGTGVAATPLSAGSATVSGTYGDLVIHSDGSYSYTPNNANAEHLAQGQPATDTFTYTVTDTTGATASSTLTFNITGQNDAPVIAGAGQTASLFEDGASTTATGNFSATDVDTGATQAWQVLNPTQTYGSLAVGSTGAWTYTLANASSAVQSLSAGQQVSDIFTVQVTDDFGATSTQTVTVNVNGINDAPTVDLNGPTLGINNTAAYTENAAAVSIAPNASVVDIDSANLNGGKVTVAFTGGLAEDQLVILTDGTVTLSGSVVNLNGVAVGTIDAINNGANGAALEIDFNNNGIGPGGVATLLSHIGYSDNSDNPSTAARTLTVSVNDGDGVANGGQDTGTAQVTVNVTAVDDAPTITIDTSTRTTLEDHSVVIQGTNTSFADVDLNNGTLLVKLDVANGTLTATAGATASGVTVDPTHDGSTGHLWFTGTLAQVNAAIAAGVNYNPTADSNGADALSISVSDQGNTGTGGPLSASTSIPISVTPVNDAPVVDLNGAPLGIDNTAAYTENAAAVSIAPNASVVDIDSANFNGGRLTVAFTGGLAEDQLVILTDGTVTLSGSVVNLNGVAVGTIDAINNGANGAALEIDFNNNGIGPGGAATLLSHIGYLDNSDNPSTATRTLTVSVNDGDGTLNGGQDTGTAQVTVNVTAVDDAPTITIDTTTRTTLEDHSVVIQGTNTSFADVDLNNGTLLVKLDVANGTLTATAGATASGVTVDPTHDGSTGHLWFTGTLAQVNAAIAAGVNYNPTADTNGADALSISVSDQGGTGTGGPQVASTSIPISVTPVNDAPVLALNNGGSVTDHSQNPVVLASGLTLTDVDSTTLLSATVKISANYQNGEDVLDFVNTTKIQGIFDAGSGTLTLTAIGAQTPNEADFQAALRSVTFTDTSALPSTLARTVTFTVQDPDGTANNGADTSTATTTVNVVNDDVYGSTNLSSPLVNSYVDVTLNATAIAALNSNHANIAFGGEISTLDTNVNTDEYVFGFSGGPSDLSQLVVTVDNGTGPTTVYLDATVRGFYSSTGNYDAGSDNYVAGNSSGETDRDFFVYDLSQLPVGTVQSAYLHLYSEAFASPTGTETYVVHAVSTAITTLTDANGQLGRPDIYNDLGSPPINHAPSLELNNGNSITEINHNTIAVAPWLSLTDLDGGTLAFASIQITGNYHNGEDVLAFTDTADIHGDFNASNGTLTLTAVAGHTTTDTDFQAALRSVTYLDNSNNPSADVRTLTFTVQDTDGTAGGGADTSSATATLNVTTDDTFGNVVLDSTVANNTAVVVALNSTAVTELNSNHGQVAIGGEITTLDGDPNTDEFAFGFSGGTDASQLWVTINNVVYKLDATSRGFYDSDGNYDAGSDNYIVGDSGGVKYRDFFVYDLSIAPLGQIQSASLHLFSDTFASPTGTETYVVHQVSTSIATLTDPNGQIGQTGIYIDLGSNTDPIVLDLGTPGINLTSLANPVSFDLTGSGSPQSVAWTAGDDGILVRDLDHSGAIESGKEVFSPFFNGGGFHDSLGALASQDSNGDGVIDANDAAYADIEVWQDTNHDGVSETGELHSLADEGIASIDLHAQSGSGQINGQQVIAQGSFTLSTGEVRDYAAVQLDQTSAPAVVQAGAGDAVLTGNGAAPDKFVFAAHFGNDTVTNYTPGTDSLQFDHAAFADTAALLAATEDVNGNAVITHDAGESVTLNHVTKAQLAAHQTDLHIA